MTRQLLTIILLTTLLSCSDRQSNYTDTISKDSVSTTRAQVKTDTTEKTKKPTAPTVFFIKDTTKYSVKFLKEFKDRHNSYETVSLISDTIIINDDRNGLIIIPTDLPLKKKLFYRSPLKDRKSYYKLWITRINYSTIEYEYGEDDKGVLHGFADLEPVFYFGAEGTFEDKDGRVFGMNEYIDNSSDSCSVTILIGVGNLNQSFFKFCDKADGNKLKTLDFYK